MGMEVLIVKKLDGGLRGLRNGTKTIEQARINYFLGKLLHLNEGLHDDYVQKYVTIQRNNNK
jgi:hypothetical protein